MPQPQAFSVEIETSSGRTYRWGANSAKPSERPVIGPWPTQIGDGWGPSTVELARRLELHWPDLGLMDTLRYIAADESVAYEGRIHRADFTTGGKAVVSTVGWATYLHGRPFTEIYVDRDPSAWGSPSLDLRIAQVNADRVMDVHYTAEGAEDSLRFSGTEDENVPTGSRAILEYSAPTDCLVSEIQYRGVERNIAAAQEEDPTLYADDDDGQTFGNWDSYALTLDDDPQAESLTTPRRYLALILNAAAAHTPNAPAHRTYKDIAVYGTHDAALVDNGNEPDGVTASAVIDDILSRFAPKMALETPGTTYPIGHLRFDEPTSPYDAILRCNEFHHWNLAVYEGPTLHFEPIDLSRADWLVSEEWGATVSDGISSEHFVNGVPVTYDDITTGRRETLWPHLNEELRDDDEENPANQWGEEKWAEAFSVPFSCTEKMALQLGQEQLLEINTPRRPGTLTVPTRLKDANHNWQPSWKPRSGETVEVVSRPDLAVQLITGTSYDPQSKVLDISTDYDLRTLDAFFARYEVGRVG